LFTIATLTTLAHGFVALPSARPAAPGPQLVATASSPLPLATRPQTPAPLIVQTQRCAAPQMGLFGLGTPELAIIAVVGLVVLGPDQLKKLAKDVGKVSAELKQVPEEFNKGMEIGQEELEKRKLSAQANDPPPPTPPPPAE
jgi:sec-independent protein translocase protein TatA